MAEITSTSSSYRPPADQLHDSETRVVLDVPARVVFKVLLVIGIAWLAVEAIGQLTGLLVQIAIAAFLAVAADPLVRRMERRGIGRGRAVLVVMLGAIAFIALVVAIFIPPLVDQADNLIEAAPEMVQDVRDSSWYERLDREYDIVDRASEQAASLPGRVSNQLGTVLAAVAAGLLGTITILFLTVFLLLGGGQVVEGVVRVFPKLAERRWWSIVHGAYSGIAAYVGGVIVIAMIAGTVMTVTALSLGLPYALPLGLWMGMLVVIPLIGATIGAIPAVIVAFVSGGVVKGIVMLVVVIAYQQLENIVIQPRVQGKAASLSPFVVFLSVLVGSQLLGVLGALFAVPVAGVIGIFIQQLVLDQGSHDMQVPALTPDDVPDPPDVDDDGKPGVSDSSGRPI